MSIFNFKKLIIKKDIKADKVVFKVGYYKVKPSGNYKSALLKALIGNSTCLAVISSKFMYKEQKKKFPDDQQVLLSKLNNLGIGCRTLTVLREDEMLIFGLSVKQGEKKLYQDLVIGFAMEACDIEAAEKAVSDYNTYYYIDRNGRSKAELLDGFQASLDDDVMLKAAFRYSLFDDSFVESTVITCNKEDSDFVSEQLELLQSIV